MQVERLKKYFGTAEIIVYANRNSPSNFFRSFHAEKYEEEFEYIVPSLEGVLFINIPKEIS